MNMDHVSAIVRAAVARFCVAWKDISLDEKAINKLYNHLYGPDKTLWQYGYEAGPPVNINFEAFSTQISDQIIEALSARKEVFAFLAKVISLQIRLKGHSVHEEHGPASDVIEQYIELSQEALSDFNKQYIFTHTLGQLELLDLSSRLESGSIKT